MPRPKILSSLPAQSEVVETASTLTFKIVLLAPDKVGEIISTERIGDKLVVKTKVRQETPSQPSGPFTVSFT
jgi:hypothetical protein